MQAIVSSTTGSKSNNFNLLLLFVYAVAAGVALSVATSTLSGYIFDLLGLR